MERTTRIVGCRFAVAVRCPAARFVVAGKASDARYAASEEEVHTQARKQLGDRLVFSARVLHCNQCWLGWAFISVHCATAGPFILLFMKAMAMQRPSSRSVAADRTRLSIAELPAI